MKNALKLVFFFEILMKFVGISRTSSENVKMCGELQKILKKLRKFGQNPETDEIIQSLK